MEEITPTTTITQLPTLTSISLIVTKQELEHHTDNIKDKIRETRQLAEAHVHTLRQAILTHLHWFIIYGFHA